MNISTCPVTFINCHINLNIDNNKIISISYDKEKNKDKCYKKISDNEFKLFYIFNGNNDIIQSLNIENYTISENSIVVKGFNIIMKHKDPTQNNTVFEINLENTYTFSNNEIQISGSNNNGNTSFLRTTDGNFNLKLDQLTQVCENIQEAVDIFLCQISPSNLNLIKKFIDSLIDDTANVDDPIKLLKTYISKIDSPIFYNSNNSIPFSFYLNRMTQYLLLIPGAILSPIISIVSFIGLTNWINK